MINHRNKDDIGIIGVEGIPAGSTFLAAFQFPHSFTKKLPPRNWSRYLIFIFFYFFISQRRSIVKATVNSAILLSVVSLLNFLLLQLVRKTMHKDWRIYVRAKKKEKKKKNWKAKGEIEEEKSFEWKSKQRSQSASESPSFDSCRKSLRGWRRMKLHLPLFPRREFRLPARYERKMTKNVHLDPGSFLSLSILSTLFFFFTEKPHYA